jgi:hypothetical protein
MDLPEKPTVKTERLYARGRLEYCKPGGPSATVKGFAKTAAAAGEVLDC